MENQPGNSRDFFEEIAEEAGVPVDAVIGFCSLISAMMENEELEERTLTVVEKHNSDLCLEFEEPDIVKVGAALAKVTLKHMDAMKFMRKKQNGDGSC